MSDKPTTKTCLVKTASSHRAWNRFAFTTWCGAEVKTYSQYGGPEFTVAFDPSACDCEACLKAYDRRGPRIRQERAG